MNLKHVLILNAGSSSLKWAVLDAQDEAVVDQGNRSWEGSDPGRHEAEVQALVRTLPPIDAVGHRIVHGGAAFQEAVLVDDRVRDGIAALAELAPLHNPAGLAGITAVAAAHPNLPQVAAFDTAFHATIPEAAAQYGLPWEWTDRWALRRYGFHGLSVAYAVRLTTELLGALPPRLVVCHLGAGCSVTAVAHGRSIDTSMGFTPLEGMLMATRSGSIDPGLLLHLLQHQGIAADDLDRTLNERSGLLGVSGATADLRAVRAAADAGDPRASRARAMFMHSLVRTVGAMIAVLGGLDALAFTGGIGEHAPWVRQGVATACSYTGLSLDHTANAASIPNTDIAAPASPVRAPVITAREDLSVLREVQRLLA